MNISFKNMNQLEQFIKKGIELYDLDNKFGKINYKNASEHVKYFN